MNKLNKLYFLAFLLPPFMLGGCAPNEITHDHFVYKENQPVCPLEAAVPGKNHGCKSFAVQQYNGSEADYLLGFVEYDEQGQLFDRKQLDTVISAIKKEADNNDLIMVAYVHGWHHSSDENDSNLEVFRKALMTISEQEKKQPSSSTKKPPKIVGLYIGWRGDSLTLEGFNNVTFWDRKNTAHKLGYGGLSEVFIRLDDIRNAKNHVNSINSKRSPIGDTKLIIIGHSFGGTAVLSSISNILAYRSIYTTCNNQPRPSPDNNSIQEQLRISQCEDGYSRMFADLVLLINPAIEAQKFSTLHDLSFARMKYIKNQLPVFLTLASENDFPVNNLFPNGRRFSTLFEEEQIRDRFNPVTGEIDHIDEHQANIEALGHFTPYNTHRLGVGQCQSKNEVDTKMEEATSEEESLLLTSEAWDNENVWDKPFKVMDNKKLTDLCLKSHKKTAYNNPYLVVSVDEAIIDGHNDLKSEKMMGFISQFIHLSSQNIDTRKREELRSINKAKFNLK